ncbi:MAG: sialate O-acetylesterase [Bacteroidales bacterium]
MKNRFILIAIFIALNTTLFSQDSNFHIYLCFGQSNMEGQGTIENQDKTVDNRFKVFQALNCPHLNREKGTWYTATPPLCQCYSGLSPADYFGRVMIANLPDSITVGVINVAVGGCDIRLFDKDIYRDYDSTYTESWFTDKVKAYGWNPYQHLIDLALEAQKDGVIKGILLHQGETNTGNQQWPTYVKKIYTDMLADLSLNADSVPLLAGEVLSAPGNCCASMNTIINKLPQTIETSYVISSDNCPGQDEAHFNSVGYRILGNRYGKKMLSHMGYEVDITADLDTHESDDYALHQNYPNPFSTSTHISFNLAQAEFVTLKIYTTQGIEVSTISEKFYAAGTHSIEFSEDSLPAGNYLYKLTTNSFSETKTMQKTSQ